MARSAALNRRQFLTLDAPVSPPPADGYWIRLHRGAMACRFEVVLPGEDAAYLPAARTALNLADRLEARLTVFRDTSEVSHVNRTAGDGPVTVHPALFDLLSLSATIHRDTTGAFDITSTPLSRCWGFLRRDGKRPTSDAIDAARAAVGMHLVELDPERQTVRFQRREVELNLGSIGKGHALDVMAAKLRRLGVRDVLLSAGGSSILAVGSDHGRGGWPVDLRPRLASRGRLARLRLRDAAIATSGAGEQFVLADGRRYGHVLDPRTGWPASGVLSATVIARRASVADALSTAFLVDGPGLAARYCAAHADTMALLALEDGERVEAFGACAGVMVEED
ncbi:MAG TPA: FAD:protein FMN transferase [Vicinamibacterales bacterium]|nr:FAD:protein FMN transferase [Vicinamibacterales bacterium]